MIIELFRRFPLIKPRVYRKYIFTRRYFFFARGLICCFYTKLMEEWISRIISAARELAAEFNSQV